MVLKKTNINHKRRGMELIKEVESRLSVAIKESGLENCLLSYNLQLIEILNRLLATLYTRYDRTDK
jgi:hypothetical protein